MKVGGRELKSGGAMECKEVRGGGALSWKRDIAGTTIATVMLLKRQSRGTWRTVSTKFGGNPTAGGRAVESVDLGMQGDEWVLVATLGDGERGITSP